jgi:glycosyltransferase involved in cell wall biosynthesis
MRKLANRVSVCIITYNQAAYLEQAIRSVTRQTLLPAEIIVSDDCSTDETPHVLRKLAAEFSFLKVVQQARNLGIAKNTDACLRMAAGDFIVRLDSDDCLLPAYIEKLTAFLIKYPLAGYAHAAVREINKDGAFLKTRKLFRASGFQSDVYALKASIRGYRVTANILMFRKEALIAVNYLFGRPDFGEDYHLTAAISGAGFGNVYLNEVLSCYRVWTDAEKIRTRRKLTEIKGVRQVFEEVIEPAYKAREWNLNALKSSKTNLACQHADCLGWEIFNDNEKKQLAYELTRLSTSLKVKLCSWMYLNGFGALGAVLFNFKPRAKSIVKKIW